MVHALAGGLIATVALAAVYDVRTRRIPNGLTVGALVFALLVRAAPGGDSLADGVIGLALASAILIPLFVLRVIGGGDTKLLMAVAAFLGPRELVVALLATALAGGALALVAAIRQRALIPALFSATEALRYGVTLGRSGHAVTETSVTVPYAVAIAVGALAALYLVPGI